MKVLIAPDKFKGSLTADEVAAAIAKGVRAVWPQAGIESIPLADGGEGTCALLTTHSQGTMIECTVTGPRFTRVPASYGISGDGQEAFIEMAAASGLMLLRPEDRDPLVTTTFGTGELIAHALDRQVSEIVLGIGGSATNDAGIGMASALGYRFFDSQGVELRPVGASLVHLHTMAASAAHARLGNVRVVALCDVTNRLYGPDGAAYVYAHQKGADRDALALLDEGLRNFSRVIEQATGIETNFPGAGAAGGLGAGARVFLNASLERGIDYMINTTGLVDRLKDVQLVITGEGRIDTQSLSGKVVLEVTRLARDAGIPTMAVCGSADLSPKDSARLGLQQIISLVDENTSAEHAIEHAAELISRRVETALQNMNDR